VAVGDVSGALVIVATPIGNLADISPRALEILASADVVYCEDTRHTRQIFSAKGLSTSGRLRALHEHNEASLCDAVVAAIREGRTIALVSDAGTPGVSDPGARVIAAVADAGLTVSTTPGPSAVIGALSVSGLPMERFCFEGFIPRKAGERSSLFRSWRSEKRTIVAYESPQRLATTLREMCDILGDRPAVVVRELTKMHEEVLRGTVQSLAEHFDAHDARGEIVVVVGGDVSVQVRDDDDIRAALADELERGVSVRDAAASVASALDVPHRRTYELALSLRRGEPV